MRITVTPTEGRVVRDPKNGSVVPPTGTTVAPSAYWRRLALDGDLTIELGDEAEAAPEAEADPDPE